jgi:hypothetical protein
MAHENIIRGPGLSQVFKPGRDLAALRKIHAVLFHLRYCCNSLEFGTKTAFLLRVGDV